MLPVTLKIWHKTDAAALAVIANNRNIFNQVRDSFPQPYTVTDALKWIEIHGSKNPYQNYAIWVDDQLVGSIGFVPQEHERGHVVEIGYFIGEPFWGKGIATAAIEKLLQLLEQNKTYLRIEACVFSKNTASMKVLQKNKFYLEGIQHKAAIKNNVMLDIYIWVKFLQPK
ncbi:MAG: GNAT family N-acetyltransferase [Hydrotalea flava]|uniref:GNAT family N-acetyltransferase n=1 Tax=Hydrotalea TaxID=1004300 RepID=UPI000945AE8F|nr:MULTISPECIES: GNAT family protein [Hydrotalea]MBY0348235.1 GNAT family N-acetyltransferase [Hydrotalea flava]NIM36139.1 GNAT family N-acetyltransferase [Hydrotalea flava]NIM38986.1 GNAT family N-acetyltransferase [Hydrotalea flava]NIN04175.1 GNAT family N-acetyltransferase [Hydrotalea flava]NIN15848.1 GNAT family N-acetyltransferase [Hydrotalea flava]